MVLSTKPNMEDQLTGQDASLIEATTQPVSATASVVKLTSPIVPPDQTEEKRHYVLVVTSSVRSLNLQTTGVILDDMVTALARGVAFWNPCMAAVLPRPIPERRIVSYQGATMKELGGKMWNENAIKDQLMTAFGRKSRLMTIFGWKDWDTFWMKPPCVLLFIPVICHGSYLCLLIGRVHALHLYVVTAISRYFRIEDV